MRIAIAVALIAAGAAARLLPHPQNGVAIMALALFAGARLPRAWAFLVPIAAMALSDLVIDWGSGYSGFGPVRLTIYGTIAVVTLAGGLLKRTKSRWVEGLQAGGGSVLAASLFFLTTNFAVWATPMVSPAGSFAMYPPTVEGLGSCYVAAIPFFGNALAAELLGVAALFGLDALAASTLANPSKKPKAAWSKQAASSNAELS